MYTVHPSIAHMQAIFNNLPKTTGKNVKEWLDLISQSGIQTEKEIRAWLKKNFQMGDTTAAVLASCAVNKGIEFEAEDYLKTAHSYVEEMYAGPKEHLRPLHDTLIDLVRKLYPDIKISPCKTIVPHYRHHVIAQIKPATRKRIDFGLCLRAIKGPLSHRLIETGGLVKGDRITHRIEIHSSEDINDEVAKWFARAYELDTKS